MITFVPGNDRWKLGFKKAALESFQFLRDYGLECVESDVTLVRYDSPNIFVNTYHGRGSYELNVEIGRHEGPRKDSPLALDAVLGWRRAPERKLLNVEIPLFRAENAESVREMLPKIAALFRKYAEPLLEADQASFESFDDYCTVESIRLTERYTKGTTRWKASKAFQQKDWKLVIELYESIRRDLSQTEGAELAHAEQQVLASESVPSVPAPQEKL